MSKKKYYAVVNGREPGIYDVWPGEGGAVAQVMGFTGAVYKGFASLADAKRWFEVRAGGRHPQLFLISDVEDESTGWISQQEALSEGIVIYTDGSCIGNPGPGGYGVVLLFEKHRKELTGGFRLTTNNRMELTACIAGLQTLKVKSSVILYSDSKYVVDSVSNWARRWRANRWIKKGRQPVENADLWKQLLDLCDKHDVQFVWVAGHAGNPGNERCDYLSMAAAQGADLPPDTGYENRLKAQPTLF